MNFLDQLNDPKKEIILKDILEGNYEDNNGCWEWLGPASGGYGKLAGFKVHRLAYALLVADFCDNSFICHHCDNPRCYRPEHLYVGNAKTNGRDASKRKRIKGNPLYKR